MYEPPKIPIKKIVALTLVGLIIAFVIYAIWNNSFISISVSGNQPGAKIDYQIINQASGKISAFQSTDNAVKKRVSRGAYVVVASQANSNYFAQVTTTGLLSTKSVSGNLQKEKSRQFIGNNPGNCMVYIGGRLISYACTDTFANINIHQPATSRQPTFVLRNPNPSGLSGYTQGLAKTSLGTIAFIKTADSSENASGYLLYKVSNNLGGKTRLVVPGLDANLNYSLVPYQDGFLIYNQNLSQAYYYSALNKGPLIMNLPNVQAENLQPAFLSISRSAILTAFTAGGDQANKKINSEIVITDNRIAKHYTFANTFTSAVICGQQLLCAVDSLGLHTYNIAGDQPTELYSIRDVAQVIKTPDSVLAVTKQGVVRLNPAKGDGFLEYSFAGYNFNAISLDSNNYILSLSNSKGDNVALYINQTAPARDQIDKQILQIRQNPAVSSISAYGRYIYLVPNLGELNQTNGVYDYDPGYKAAVNSEINQAIAKSGIDRSYYQITNTIP